MKKGSSKYGISGTPEYRRAYYLANRDHLDRLAKEWYNKNRERRNATIRAWQKANPVRSRTNTLKRLYGITWEDYYRILENQNHCCAVCGANPIRRPDLDHDHVTNRVRGIICHKCNLMVGLVETSGVAVDVIERYMNQHRREAA